MVYKIHIPNHESVLFINFLLLLLEFVFDRFTQQILNMKKKSDSFTLLACSQLWFMSMPEHIVSEWTYKSWRTSNMRLFHIHYNLSPSIFSFFHLSAPLFSFLFFLHRKAFHWKDEIEIAFKDSLGITTFWF